MADEALDEHFVELVSSVSHANGVFRVTLGQQLEAGSAKPVARLLIPANQLQAVLRGIAEGANEIREKLQAQSSEEGGKDDKDGQQADEAGKKKGAARKPAAKK
ncbi:MAG: hypothetical protein RIA64_15020 [Rhodospirillales bacterium]